MSFFYYANYFSDDVILFKLKVAKYSIKDFSGNIGQCSWNLAPPMCITKETEKYP